VKRVTYALSLVIVMTLLGGLSGHLLAGLMGSDTSSVTVTVIAKPLYSSPGGDGEGWDGGVAGEDEEAECPAGTVSTTGMVNEEGIALQDIIVASFDEQFYLTIDEGTSVLTPDGTCPICIGICEVTTLPPLPEEACIIGCMYDAFPDEVIFDPPATLQSSYDPNDLPEGIVAGECLSVACYDQTSCEWVDQCCVVDTETYTLTAEVSRFHDFAVLGYEPEPAAFEVSSLYIYPTEVEIGETVNITVLVDNTGGQPGSYQLTLKIDSVTEAGGEVAAVAEVDREVVIKASASERVSFTTSKDTPGLYTVEVAGLTGSFEVKPPLSPVEPANWWLIGGIIAGVAIVIFVTFLFLLRRR
jgi:hypothetical protein